ncbi:hypothetical protein K2173_021617 [Erythroxylum novogranatense]|uniref:BHLH domain-containing protein n=1 Tax=Erythroxylum novogranatense TaxID=1862640 RepID=A0AAV8TRD7_9ROSI|nr:hypothetical protein K2173_021617 [Erythroxylum novogranatense]
MEMEHNSGVTLPVLTPLSLNYESFDLNEWFASFCNGNIAAINWGSSNGLKEITQSSIWPVDFSAFTPDAQQERISPFSDTLSTPNQLHADYIEAQAHKSVNFGAHFLQLPTQSAFPINKPDRKTSGVKMCSDDCSVMTSTQFQRPLEMGTQESPNVFLKSASTPLSCRTSQGVSTSASFSETGELVNLEKAVQQKFGGSVEDQSSVSLINETLGELPQRETSLERLPEGFELCDLTTDISYYSSIDDPSEWFTPSPSISGMKNMGIENVLQSTRVTSTSHVVGDILLDNLFKHPVNSVKSSIANSTFSDVFQNSVIANGDDNPLEGLGPEVWCGQDGGYCENFLKPVMGCNLFDVSTSASKGTPKLDAGSILSPRKGLFSELGIEELLDGGSNSTCVSKSSTSDQVSTVKKRRIGTPMGIDNQVHSVSLLCSSDITRQNFDSLGATKDLSRKEFFPKSQVGLWIDDSYSISTHNTVLERPKKLEEQGKAMKKRARPGESNRPRPKDRQQIQDRIKELRGIIPDSTKCSIDSLLDRTIKHMLFLQSVTKCADKLKQTNQPKLFGQENITVLENDMKRSAGAMWALEIGEQTMACPVIVEELGPAGLILIEMVCEDRGLFLEIADAIRDFGLNIWQGVMETREDKIWGRFIVEAKTHVTRVEIFLSLLELLHKTSTSMMDSTNLTTDAFNGRIPLLSNYHQSTSHCPITVAERHQ